MQADAKKIVANRGITAILLSMLKIQRRHQKSKDGKGCKRSEWDQGYTKCACPLFITGTLNGHRVKTSTAKFLPPDQARNIEAARDLALHWERTGAVCRPPETALMAELVAEKPHDLPTIENAALLFVAKAESGGRAAATIRKKKTIFTTGKNGLLSFARNRGLRFVQELTLETIEQWRGEWKLADRPRFKQQKSVIGFLWFCEKRKWLPPNTAHEITEQLGFIIDREPAATQPFSRDQYRRLLEACDRFSDRPSVEPRRPGSRGPLRGTVVSAEDRLTGSLRIRTVVELMRWTGLRIEDAVTLRRDRLTTDPATGLASIRTHQKKTGELVYCPVPPHLVSMLRHVPPGPKQAIASDDYFFWTGRGKPDTVARNWWRTFQTLFALTDLSDLRSIQGALIRPKSHMLRDTYAVEALLSGMAIHEVSAILGHKSIKTTEESYLHWVPARQTSLNEAVVKSWIAQGIIQPAGIHAVTALRATG